MEKALPAKRKLQGTSRLSLSMKQALLNPGAAADSQDVGMQLRTAVMTGKSAGTAFPL